MEIVEKARKKKKKKEWRLENERACKAILSHLGSASNGSSKKDLSLALPRLVLIVHA